MSDCYCLDDQTLSVSWPKPKYMLGSNIVTWNLFDCSDHHDMAFVGDDGVKVPVNRSALSASHSYFKSMLGGKFGEGKKHDVPLPGFDHYTITDAVYYLLVGYTIFPHLGMKRPYTQSEKTFTDRRAHHVQRILHLYRFAHRGCLDDMRVACHSLLMTLDEPRSTFTVFSYYADLGLLDDDYDSRDLAKKCLSSIACSIGDFEVANHPMLDTCKKGVEIILEKTDLQASETTLLQLLQLWGRQNGATDDAKSLLRLVDLTKIRVSDIRLHVENGLVSKDMLEEVICRQTGNPVPANDLAETSVYDELRCWNCDFVPHSTPTQIKILSNDKVIAGVYLHNYSYCFTKSASYFDFAGNECNCCLGIIIEEDEEADANNPMCGEWAIVMLDWDAHGYPEQFVFHRADRELVGSNNPPSDVKWYNACLDLDDPETITKFRYDKQFRTRL